jgi:hypothetical protein
MLEQKAEIKLVEKETDYAFRVILYDEEHIFNVIIKDDKEFKRLEFEFGTKYYTLNQLKMIASMIPVIEDLIKKKDDNNKIFLTSTEHVCSNCTQYSECDDGKNKDRIVEFNDNNDLIKCSKFNARFHKKEEKDVN